MEVINFSFEKLKRDFKTYPTLGEMKITVTSYEEGYKINILDSHILHYIGLDGKEFEEDKSTTIVNIYTDNEDMIEFVEHSFNVVNKDNKDIVIFLASFIGKQIVGLEQFIK